MIDAAKKSDVALEFEPGGIINGKDAQSISRRSRERGGSRPRGKRGTSSQVFSERMERARSMNWRAFWMRSGRS